MKVVLIDDESRARNLMRNILEENCSDDIDAIFEAGNLEDGVSIIKENSPNLVFLDVEMPQEQGLNIFKYFNKEELTFDLVFATAYSEYAVNAFEMNAIDYLLKPIRPNKVIEVIDRVKSSSHNSQIHQRLEELQLALSSNSFDKIGLPVSDGILFIPIKDIIHLEAEGSYTNVFTQTHGKKLVSKPLRFFENLLDKSSLFYKPHRSHILNLKFIRKYIRKDGNYIKMENDNIVPVSKERRDEFLKLVSAI